MKKSLLALAALVAGLACYGTAMAQAPPHSAASASATSPAASPVSKSDLGARARDETAAVHVIAIGNGSHDAIGAYALAAMHGGGSGGITKMRDLDPLFGDAGARQGAPPAMTKAIYHLAAGAGSLLLKT